MWFQVARFLSALIWLNLVNTSFASSGDRLPEFRQCVHDCVVDTCPRPLPLSLMLLQWTCSADCDYLCQQKLTDYFELKGLPIHQYHGKWPFRRLLGIQEPASTLFSILNFVPNYYGYKLLKRRFGRYNPPMLKYYLMFALVGMNTWTWSMVFHIRDFPWTEKLDYFSAIGSILYGLFLVNVRLFGLYKPQNRATLVLVASLLALYFTGHVYYLSFVRFNYGYNMTAAIIFGIAQTSMWIIFSCFQYFRSRSAADLIPTFVVLGVAAGMSFEIFDFPPLGRTFDAHSLWHAATILPTHFWYRWMRFDLGRCLHK